MSTAIVTTTQYGKQQFSGINHMGELDEDGSEQYAHSFGDAREYVESLPLMQGCEVMNPQDGRMFFWSQWQEVDWAHSLYNPGNASHQRTMIGIAVRETI